MTIWRTDANGQLGKNNQDQNSTHIIGPYANHNEKEKGNGQCLCGECEENNLIPMNRWKRPKTKQTRKQLNKNTQTEEYKKQMGELIKQNNHMGKRKKIKRQIGYVMINRRFRNCVRKPQTITGRKANMQQTQQRNVIIIRICVKLAKSTGKTPHQKQEQESHTTYKTSNYIQKDYKNIWN